MRMRHAIEADHTAAIATLATKNHSVANTLKQGLTWGLGHTITLLLQSPNDGPSSFTFTRFSLPGPIRRLDGRNGRVRCAHPADTPTNRFSASRDYLHCDIRSWVNAGNGHPPDGHRYPPPLFIPFNTLASQRSAGLHRRDHDCPWAHADLHDRLQPFELTSRSFQISGKCSLEVSCPPLNLNLPLCSRNFI